MGQCYAGAFVGSLQGEGRVIIASCGIEELSWACPDRPYDEFVYHWTCAVAHHDENGKAIDADQNHDGKVTADEAYSYASQHDRRPETPSITAFPAPLATRWWLNGVLTETDIVDIHDKQYNNTTVFDLQGRRIKAAVSSGLYIAGGKIIYKKR
jgi:hypothetical protein